MKQTTAIFSTTALAFFSFLWIKALYPSASGLPDTDFFWHIAYGQWMLEHGTIPPTDTFSWTFSGTPYQLTQWGGELIMGWAYEHWGLTGTRALSVLLAGITLGFSWAAAKQYVNTNYALAIASICNLVQLVTPMRPQLFSFALISVGLYLLVRWLRTGALRYLTIYAAMMALWVNLHGAFVMGLGMIGLVGLGVTIDRWKDNPFSHQSVLTIWVSIAGATIASLLNPHGVDAIANVFMISGLESSKVISEWKPVNLTTDLGWFYLLNLVPFVALISLGSRIPAPHALLAGAFLVFGILANRQVPMCAAAMAPLMAIALARSPQFAAMNTNPRDPRRPLAHALAMVAMGALLIPLSAARASNEDKERSNRYPVEATAFLEQENLTNRVLSDTLEASWLIHKGIPVFVDGRMDLYRDRFYFEWYLAARAAPGWDSLLEQYAPSALLLRNDMAIRQAAMATGAWKQVYQDNKYSVLVPAASHLAEVASVAPEYLDEDGRMQREYLP